MADANDMDLLREFASHNSEPAFAELVRRHINLVYSVALRFTGNTGDAQDVTQAVFIILARKAAGLSARTVLTGWLYETTRFTAIRLLRTQGRRQAHEQEAFMQSILEKPADDSLWRQLAPHLEAAMSRLAERDRTLLALRFYENKTGAEAAALLGIREEAARKRTNRALEKLRIYFTKRGVDSTTAIIAGTISANSVQAAPVALAKSVTAGAIAKGAAASGSTLTLIKGVLKIMAWTKAKTTVAVGVVILLTAATSTIVIQAAKHYRPSSKLEMRTFAVDARAFSSNLRNATGSPADASIIDMATNYFASKGLNFGPPKSIFFNDPKSPLFVSGLLIVKATPADLKAVEKIIQQLTYAPPQVHIKTYFIDVPESNVESILKAGTVVDTKEENIVEIMSAAQTSLLLRGLRSSGAMILGDRDDVTQSGRQTQLLSSGDTTVDLVSTLFDDGFTLKMKVIVSAPENLLANVNIWDEQTIVLAPNNSNDGKTRLLVFVTSTLVDSAGNRIDFKNKLPFNPSTIPPQE